MSDENKRVYPVCFLYQRYESERWGYITEDIIADLDIDCFAKVISAQFGAKIMRDRYDYIELNKFESSYLREINIIMRDDLIIEYGLGLTAIINDETIESRVFQNYIRGVMSPISEFFEDYSIQKLIDCTKGLMRMREMESFSYAPNGFKFICPICKSEEYVELGCDRTVLLLRSVALQYAHPICTECYDGNIENKWECDWDYSNENLVRIINIYRESPRQFNIPNYSVMRITDLKKEFPKHWELNKDGFHTDEWFHIRYSDGNTIKNVLFGWYSKTYFTSVGKVEPYMMGMLFSFDLSITGEALVSKTRLKRLKNPDWKFFKVVTEIIEVEVNDFSYEEAKKSAKALKPTLEEKVVSHSDELIDIDL